MEGKITKEGRRMRILVGLIAASFYVATIFAANYAIDKWGLVSVGFGLLAPAGVYFAGLAFTLRDTVQLTLGRVAVLIAISIGAICSYFVNPIFAFASAFAFFVSEFVDFAIFSLLLTRGKLFLAILLSGFAGLVVDSMIFLQLAFGNLDFLEGQIVGKTWVLLASLPLYFIMRKIIKDKVLDK